MALVLGRRVGHSVVIGEDRRFVVTVVGISRRFVEFEIVENGKPWPVVQARNLREQICLSRDPEITVTPVSVAESDGSRSVRMAITAPTAIRIWREGNGSEGQRRK